MSIPFPVYRMNIEEEMLIEEFGEQYKSYIENTWKLVPFLY
ncbi:hypothetical protein ACFL0D_03885 [Thermoproteota archaeon]